MPVQIEVLHKIEGMTAAQIEDVLKNSKNEIKNVKDQIEAESNARISDVQSLDEKIKDKADKNDIYTKVETENLISEKADKTTTYTKAETDNLISEKADKCSTLSGYGIEDAYTISETDTLIDTESGARAAADNELQNSINAEIANREQGLAALESGKADKADTYTKQEVVDKCLYYYGDSGITPTDNKYFSITNNGMLTRSDSWDDNITNLIIPFEINGINVKAIDSGAFADCVNITSVTIPYGVKILEGGAFAYCSALKTVYIPESIEEICDAAFSNCTALKNVYYRGSKSQWDTIKIGTIDDSNICLLNAFIKYEGNLATEKYVEEMCPTSDTYTTSETDALLSQKADKALFYYGNPGLLPADEKCFLISEDGIISRHPNYWDNYIKDLIIPYEIHGVEVKGIGYSAFSNCTSLETVILPNSITHVETRIFDGCSSLKKVVLSKNLEYLEDSMFYNCSALTDITIPDTVKGTGDSVFSGCKSLTCINIPVSMKNIGFCTFSGCTSLSDVSYSGSKSQWEEMNIDIEEDGNENLLNAAIEFKDNLATEQLVEEMCSTGNVIVEVNESETDITYDFAANNNTDTRIRSAITSMAFYTYNFEPDSEYISSLSFYTSDSVPEISYPAGGVINWCGTDCSLNNGQSVFLPTTGKFYDIFFYYNGHSIVGMVNGYEPATANNTNEVDA